LAQEQVAQVELLVKSTLDLKELLGVCSQAS